MTKKKNNNTKLLTGALVGAVLGVAAGVFAVSDTGKKIGKAAKKEIKSRSGEFYRYIAPQLKKMKTLTEEEYNEFIDRSVKSFAKNKDLTKKDVSDLSKQAHKYWKLLKKHF